MPHQPWNPPSCCSQVWSGRVSKGAYNPGLSQHAAGELRWSASYLATVECHWEKTLVYCENYSGSIKHKVATIVQQYEPVLEFYPCSEKQTQIKALLPKIGYKGILREMSDSRKHSWSFQSEDLQEKLENEGVGCIKVEVLWCCELSGITIRQPAQFS